MPSIVIVEKTGSLKSLNVKSAVNEDLYKKAGFKSNNDFARQTTWNVELDGTHYCISLYGKKAGLAKQENKYEFPPPVDNVLYFGNCVLVNHEKDSPEAWRDLSVSTWEKVYDKLYGGFEDLGSEDSSVSGDTDDSMNALPKTKSGYAKDDFIVDDDVIEADSSDSEETPPPKPPVKKRAAPKKKEATPPPPPPSPTIENDFLGCTSELSEEDYL